MAQRRNNRLLNRHIQENKEAHQLLILSPVSTPLLLVKEKKNNNKELIIFSVHEAHILKEDNNEAYRAARRLSPLSM